MLVKIDVRMFDWTGYHGCLVETTGSSPVGSVVYR